VRSPFSKGCFFASDVQTRIPACGFSKKSRKPSFYLPLIHKVTLRPLLTTYLPRFHIPVLTIVSRCTSKISSALWGSPQWLHAWCIPFSGKWMQLKSWTIWAIRWKLTGVTNIRLTYLWRMGIPLHGGKALVSTFMDMSFRCAKLCHLIVCACTDNCFYFLATKLFSILVNSMPDERTNSNITWFNSPLRGNQDAQTLVDMIQVGQWYRNHGVWLYIVSQVVLGNLNSLA
jgi:hypothetical protein